MSIHFSSLTPEWSTPQDLFDALDKEFEFTLDPCATKKNAKCKKFYTKREDGLKQSWAGEIVFMNPPYGREIADWIEKAVQEARVFKTTVVCLVPARTDTNWWGAIYDHKNHGPRPWTKEIRFLKGRFKFSGAKNAAPFPSAIIVLCQQRQK